MSRLEKEIRQELSLVENKTRISKAKSVKFTLSVDVPSEDNKALIGAIVEKDKGGRGDRDKISLLKSKTTNGKQGLLSDPSKSSNNAQQYSTSSIDKFISADKKKMQQYNVPAVVLDDEKSFNSSYSAKFDQKLVLDTELVKKTLNDEYPNDLLLQGQGLAKIGNLSEIREIVENLRRLDISFNPFTQLAGFDQFSQLRHLSAYGCRLQDLTELKYAPKIETLMLQQNKVPKIETEFIVFKKLKELRLDRNQLTSIDNLYSCTALRVLDLSWNKIESVEGLAGLQSLTELRLNNNCIESLAPFRSLPSVTELNVSYNRLKSLEGIQMLPTLMMINASNNLITSVRIPQTYSHQHKTLDKAGGEKSDKDKDQKDSKSAASGGGKKESLSKSSKLNGTSSSMISTHPSVSAVNASSSLLPPVAILGMPCLSEINLRENQITDLSGIDTLGLAIETLDVSFNEIALRTDIVTPLKNLFNGKGENALLSDLKITGNPLLSQLSDARLERELEVIAESLLEVCPKLDLLNDCKIIVQLGNTIHKGKSSPEKEKQEGRSQAPGMTTQFSVKVLKPDDSSSSYSSDMLMGGGIGPNKVSELAKKKSQMVNLMANVASNSQIKMDFERLGYKISSLEAEKAELEQEIANIRELGGSGTVAAVDRVKQRHLRIRDELDNMREDKKNKESAYIQAQHDSRIFQDLQKECQELERSIQLGGGGVGGDKKVNNNDSDDEDSVDEEGKEFDEETNRLNQRRKAPKLFLKDMSSFDSIAGKENVFKSTLGLTRKTLHNIYDLPTDTDLDYKTLSATYQAKMLEEAADRMAAKQNNKKGGGGDSDQLSKIIALMKYAKREKKPIIINKRAPWDDVDQVVSSLSKKETSQPEQEPLFVSRKSDQAAIQLSQRQMQTGLRPQSGRDSGFYLTGESPRLDSSRMASARSNASFGLSEPLVDSDATLNSRSIGSLVAGTKSKKGLIVPEEFSKSIISTTDSHNKKHMLDWMDTQPSSNPNPAVMAAAKQSPDHTTSFSSRSSHNINQARPRSAKEFSVGFDLRSIVANLDDAPNPAMLVTKAHSARALDGVGSDDSNSNRGSNSSSNNNDDNNNSSFVTSKVSGSNATSNNTYNDGSKTPLTRSFSAPNVKNIPDGKLTAKSIDAELNSSNHSNNDEESEDDDNESAYAATATDFSFKGSHNSSTNSGDNGNENDILFEDVRSTKSSDLLSSPHKILKPKLRPNNNEFLLEDFETFEKKLLLRGGYGN